MKEVLLRRLDELYEKSIKGEFSEMLYNGSYRKSASMYVGSGYKYLDIKIDTDDCDHDAAINSAIFLRELWNAWPEIREALHVPNIGKANDDQEKQMA